MRKLFTPYFNRCRAGRRAGAALGLVLATHLALLPLAPVAHAREGGRRESSPPAFAERSLSQVAANAAFRRVGAKHTLRGDSGIKLTTRLGRWRAGGADVRGARVAIESAWGETLEVDLFIGDGGLLAEFNDRIQLLTLFDQEQRPLSLQATIDGETTISELGDHARLFQAGAPLPPDLDIAAYEALAVALHEELSPAFLKALESFDRPVAEVACGWELVNCIASIAAWVIDLALLPPACLVGGVPTFGVSCALAVIGHQLANAAIVSNCTRYRTCRAQENIPPEQPDESTPIIIDMDGRGFRLTGLDDPVVFDLTADGRPDRVSWTARGGDEAFLVLDRNRNGRIDHGGEMFGSRTPLVDGTLADDGFLALTEYDLRTMGGNENGDIDAGDVIWGRLMLWTDRDRDGVSTRRELASLDQAGVVSLSLQYKVSNRRDRHGNQFVLNSKAMVRERGRVQPRAMTDVYLRIEQ